MKFHQIRKIPQAILVLIIFLTTLFLFNFRDPVVKAFYPQSTAVYKIANQDFLANQDGSEVTLRPSLPWIGTGSSTKNSFLGLIFTGEKIPQGTYVNSAKLILTSSEDQWIPLKARINTASKLTNFSQDSKLSEIKTNQFFYLIDNNTQWIKNNEYSLDITLLVQGLVNSGDQIKIPLIIQGLGTQWGRKFFDTKDLLNSPRIEITYTNFNLASVPTPTLTPTPTPTPIPDTLLAVPSELLGTCPPEVHDRYTTTGPDGKLYRTWHPITVPIDLNNPNGPTCTFAHEHGDDPSTSNIYDQKPVPFGYVAAQMNPPMIEPHEGFKCHVVNKGNINDEGTTALNDSYFCLHMGTDSPGRFTKEFHSEVFNIKTEDGKIMNLQAMADTGNVGTICDNPRQGRTVLGLGCQVDSPYEIWQNVLTVTSGGKPIASATTSTAVFDPITVYDPQNPSALIYTWSDQASSIFKFTDDRSGYRDCNREEYHGPIYWTNQGGSTTYITDAFGNEDPKGTLTQTVTSIDSNTVMGYKSGNQNDPQSQFKDHRSQCNPGIGLMN